MTVVHFSKKLLVQSPNVYDLVENSYADAILSFMINWKYRKSVMLTYWIKDQLKNVPQSVQDFCDTIPNDKDPDYQVIHVMKAVRNAITYERDQDIWEMPDYWQTAEETLKLRTGDCEDGAVLQYILCRLKGVPANRLLLMCGDVWNASIKKVEGHCFLAYKPTHYPLNWSFLDWCYYYKGLAIVDRSLFSVASTGVYLEYTLKGSLLPSNYKKAWFGFNENKAIKSFKPL